MIRRIREVEFETICNLQSSRQRPVTSRANDNDADDPSFHSGGGGGGVAALAGGRSVCR